MAVITEIKLKPEHLRDRYFLQQLRDCALACSGHMGAAMVGDPVWQQLYFELAKNADCLEAFWDRGVNQQPSLHEPE